MTLNLLEREEEKWLLCKRNFKPPDHIPSNDFAEE